MDKFPMNIITSFNLFMMFCNLGIQKIKIKIRNKLISYNCMIVTRENCKIQYSTKTFAQMSRLFKNS